MGENKHTAGDRVEGITSQVERPFAVDRSSWGREPFSGVIQIIKQTEKTHTVLGGWRGEKRGTLIRSLPDYPARFDTREEAEAALIRGNAEWARHADAVLAAETALKTAKAKREEAAIKAMMESPNV